MTQTERDAYERALAVYNAGDLLVKEILTSNFANIDQPHNANYFNQLGDHQNLRPVKTDTGGFAYWNHSLTHTWARPNQDYSAAIGAAHNTYKIDWDYLRMLNSSGCDYSEDHIRYIEKPFLYAGGRQRNQATYTYTPRGQPKGSKHRGTVYCKKTSFTLIGPPGSKMKTFYQGGNSNSILIALDINCSKSVRAGKEPLAFTGNAFTNMRWWLDNQKRHLTKDVLEKVTSIKELKKTNQEIAINGTSPQHNEVLVKTRKDGVIAIIAPPRTLRARLTFPQNDRPQRLASVRAMQHLSRITGLKSLPILLRTRAGKMMPYPRLAQQADLKFAFSISRHPWDIDIYNSWLKTLSEFEQTWVSSYNFGEGTMSPLNALIEKIKIDDASKNVICPIDLKKLKQYLTIEPLPPNALESLPLAVLSQYFPFATSQLTLSNAIHYGNIKLAYLLIRQGVDLNLQSQHGRTALMCAAQNNNQAMVKELIMARADLNLQSHHGHTALILAVQKNAQKTVRELIKANANLNLQDKGGDTALMWAAFKGNLPLTELLIHNGASLTLVNTNNRNVLTETYQKYLTINAPLKPIYQKIIKTLITAAPQFATSLTKKCVIEAIKLSDTKLAKLLIQCKTISLDIQDRSGSTALILAVQKNNQEMVKELLQAKANLNLQDQDGNTALILAVRNNNPEMVRDLIRARADLNLQNQWGHTALILAVRNNNPEMVRDLIRARADLNLQDQDGNTALILAPYKGDSLLTKLLMRNKASLTLVNTNNRNVLTETYQRYLAVDAQRKPLYREIIKTLITAEPQLATSLTKECVIEAIKLSDTKLAKLLIQCKTISLDIRDQSRRTALILAVINNDQETVRELIQANADLNLQSQDGHTALMWAVINNNQEMVQELIRAKADLNSRNQYGHTALILAVQGNAQKTVKALIQAKADLNSQDQDGDTALMWAAFKGNLPLTNLLIQHGASLTPANSDNRNVLTETYQKYLKIYPRLKPQYQAIIKTLISHGVNLKIKDRLEETILSRAILSLDVKMIKLLLDKKGPQGKNYQGKTALEQICQRCTTISPKTWTIITLVLQHAHTIIDPNDLSIAKNLKDLKMIIDTAADNKTLGAAITGALQQNDIPHWQKAYLTSCQNALDPSKKTNNCMLTGFWQESLTYWCGYIFLGILTLGIGFILWNKLYSTKVSRNSSFGQKALLIRELDALQTTTTPQTTIQPQTQQSATTQGEEKSPPTATPKNTATPNHTKLPQNSSFEQKAMLVSLPTATNPQATAHGTDSGAAANPEADAASTNPGNAAAAAHRKASPPEKSDKDAVAIASSEAPEAAIVNATPESEAKQSEVAKGEVKTDIAAKPQAKEKSKATPKLTTQVKTSKLMEPVQTPTSSSQLKSALHPSPTTQGFSENRIENRLFTLMDCSASLVIF